MTQDYDVLFVVMGIWEIVRPWDCQYQTTTTLDRIHTALMSLHSMASPTLTIYWKTTGPAAKFTVSEAAKFSAMNDFVRQWFQNQQPRYMHLIDWAKQIRPRSFGTDRITGDLRSHWGLEARTLAAQMFTHAVLLTDHHLE